MKKIILLLTAVLFTASGCSLFGTMFSESRKNFDDKIERVDAYLQSQGCQLTEYTATQGQEQYIISPKYKYQGIESINKFAIENQVYLSASIMANNINKGKIYLLFQTALITDNTTNTHIDLQEKTINELTFTYDGKKITLATKKAYDTYLFGSTQFMYSDIKLMKEVANAKEITIEGRNAIGRKFTKTLTNDDIAVFKKMVNVIQEVHSILNN